ncbi:MAG: hypothetical protein U0R80_11670 [Nocardioidaceae bacterium]
MSTSDAARVAHALEEALRSGDVAAAGALAAADADAARRSLGALARNARLLHLDLSVVAPSVGPEGPGGWESLSVRWRVPGVDAARVTTTLRLRLVAGSTGALVDAVAVAGQAPLWTQGPVTVARRGDVLVTVAAGPGGADGSDGEATGAGRWLSRALDAVRTVHRVLPGWRGRLAVEVPADGPSYDAALGVEPGERDTDAAVTTTLGDPASSSVARVVVNPDVFTRQDARGQRVVLAHEATHVAVGAAASDLPLWLVEGFADYVALRDVPVPARVSAAALVDWVRSGGRLRRLPGDAWFSASGERPAVAYEASWLACVAVAERWGERALVRAYVRAERGRRVGPARARVAGMTPRWLARAVMRRVSHWAA